MKETTRPTALLVEDEAVLRAELRESLGHLWPELRIIGEAGTGIEAIHLLERETPDILFLDIQLPGMSGVEVAHHAEGRCHVTFVTAYDSHAVAAFEAGAIDYVLKPIQSARLAKTVDRLKRQLTTPPPAKIDQLVRMMARNVEKPGYLKWLNATTGQSLRIITVEEIVFFQADTKYTRVVTADGESLVKMSLRQLQDALDPSDFWQVHRSTIVNVGAIASVTRDFRGHVYLLLKKRPERLAVSESYHHLFRQM